MLKLNDMNNEEKAKEIALKEIVGCGPDYYEPCYDSALDMAQWKDEQFKEQLNGIKDEIQSNLCASSGFNDEYSHGYQDCGMKAMEMIDKILNK